MTKQAYKLSARTPATVRRPLSVVPLLLLLLFLCCASVCVAWDDGSVESTGVVRELPRTGQSGVQAYTVATKEDWKLIRIVASTKDLEDDKKYCTKVGQVVVGFANKNITCKDEDILDTKKKDEYISKIIPAAIELHRDRLLVRRGSEKLRVDQFQDDSYCKYFTVPDEHRKKGVDADFVLYVAARGGVRFALSCAFEKTSGRPIVGAMNFHPYKNRDLRFNVRRAAHEIAHALGFDYKLMKRKNMVFTENVRGKNRVMVNSTVTVKEAQKHYRCTNLRGMELAYGKDGKVLSHWDARNAKDELMSSARSSSAGYYTALTMAFFEDLKYYRANWGMAEPMRWGNNSGCDFITKKCMSNGITEYPHMFCSNKRKQCTSNRYAVGTCPDAALLADANVTDSCSFAKYSFRTRNGTLVSTLCSDETSDLLPGSLMGKDSWCLDGENLQVADKNGTRAKEVDAVCARVSCNEKKRTVEVQYKGDNNWYACPEWASINVSSSEFKGGKIKCPKYDEVCTVAFNGSSLVPFVTPRSNESH